MTRGESLLLHVSLGALAFAAAACVPADEALGLGSVQFVLGVWHDGRPLTVDDYTVDFDRIVLGFKTMTVGKVGSPELCAYHGRGATTDVVFDARAGVVVQTFNGIQPVDCPDVGIIFGPPTDATTLGNGASSADLIELATGRPAHAIIEATARQTNPLTSKPSRPQMIRIKLRFDSFYTASRFGGCRGAVRGVRILAEKQAEELVRFAPDSFFRDAISATAGFSIAPFLAADARGNGDGIATMDELDLLPLELLARTSFEASEGHAVSSVELYRLPDGSSDGFFGDYLRAWFRFWINFGTVDGGLCVGNDPSLATE